MSDKDTQTVAQDANTAVSPADAATGAQNNTSDLDSILSEFDQATTTPPAPQPAAPVVKTDSAVQERLDALERRLASEQEKKDFATSISAVKGDAPIPEYVVRGWLSAEADADPRINKIWDQRHENPAAFKKMLSGLKAKFDGEKAKLKGPDPEATSDKMAVTAALKGTTTKTPDSPAPNYGAMNDAQFAAEKAKYGL